jgi:mycothiol synthase
MTDTAYIIRNYHPEDFDNYVRLCQATGVLAPSGHPADPPTVSQWLQWPHYSPEKDLFLAEYDGEVVGGLDLRPEPSIGRIILRCWVSPQHRKKGLARQLCHRAVARARELGIRFIHVNVPEEDKTVRRILSRSGFKPVRQYLELKLDIAALNHREADRAAGECRCLEPGDEDTLADLQNRAFAGQWGYNPNTTATITYFTRLGGQSPEKVVLACDGYKIMGYCWVEVWPGIKDGDSPRGIIHMLGADPDSRAKGIGKKALLAGLSYLKNKGVKAVSLSADSENRPASALYRSVGFKLHRKTLWYEREAH